MKLEELLSDYVVAENHIETCVTEPCNSCYDAHSMRKEALYKVTQEIKKELFEAELERKKVLEVTPQVGQLGYSKDYLQGFEQHRTDDIVYLTEQIDEIKKTNL